MSDTDEQFLRRAIRLAMNGRGSVEPNPMVGCVIVKDGRIIGEGFHAEYGHAHAEPNALAACSEAPAGATAYVTLEPCCHTNKQTPPCVPRLVAAKIARVVIGCVDPNPDVNGNGIALLRAAGICVDAPLVEEEAKQLLAPFIARTVHGRPYVTLKWAQTADGKVAGAGGSRMQISNTASTLAVQELRARSQGILVGIGTVLADNPLLLPRADHSARSNYVRAVLDTSLRTPIDCKLVRSAGDGLDPRVVIYCGVMALREEGAKASQLRDHNVDVESLPEEASGRLDLLSAIRHLGSQNVSHLLVEPGPTLARSFFDASLIDRLWVIQSPRKIDDTTAPPAAAVPESFVKSGEVHINGDMLSEYLNPASNVFFALAESADLVQTAGHN